jgi:hypothetical protein
MPDLCGLLDRLITSKYASHHAQSPRCRSATGVRVASHPPCLRKNRGRRNYRQSRDNPPQFYGMLCHEVFAPHGQLHALRDINTPS